MAGAPVAWRLRGRLQGRLNPVRDAGKGPARRALSAYSRTVNSVPLLLTLSRFLLAPALVAMALWWPSRAGFGACLVAAVLSDVFDGVIARRLGIATVALRRLDSAADSTFYAAALFAAWHLHPEVITGHAVALGALAVLEGARYVVDLVKFRREASYHMWSSKLWGLALFAGFFSLLAMDSAGAFVALAIYAGIVADVEGLAISLVLREWRTDVPTLFHALQPLARAPRQFLDDDVELRVEDR